MIEKGKISGGQMAILFYPTIIATAILLVPAITGKFAQQDMWLSPIWGAVAGFLSVYIAYKLHEYYPKQTLIQYSEKITGKYIGKVIGFVYLFFFMQTNAIVLRQYGEFVVGNFLLTTPMTVVIGSITFVCALAVHGGLEVIARSAQIFVPIFIVLFLLIVIMLIPELEPKNIFPVMGKGVTPSLMGAIIPAEWFTQFFLLSFMFPYLKEKAKGLKWGMLSMSATLITLVIANIISLFVLGNLTSSFTYPVMAATRYISIGDFLEHVESVVMAIWVAGIFVKICVVYYITVIGTAQWLKLSNYKPIVWPIGFLIVILTIWSASSLQEITHFISTSWQFFGFLMQLFMPILLLLFAYFRIKIANRTK